MNISLDLYKIFYCVGKHNSISRAAEELLISQPAVSKSIKTLEEQLDTKLFIRKRDGVQLTEVGETFFIKIRSAMDIIESAEDALRVKSNMEEGTITLGASKTIVHTFLMSYITEFHELYPNINIRIFTDDLTELFNKTKLGIIDLVFYNVPFETSNNFEHTKLLTLHDCLAASNKYEYLKGKKLNLKDLEELPLIVLSKGSSSRRRLDDYCKKNNITIHPQMEVNGNTLIKEFTEAGFGIGHLTEEYIKQELKDEKLFKLNYDLKLEKKSLSMSWTKENKSLVVKTFIEYLQNKVQKKEN